MVERKRPSFVVLSLLVVVFSSVFTFFIPATPASALTHGQCYGLFPGTGWLRDESDPEQKYALQDQCLADAQASGEKFCRVEDRPLSDIDAFICTPASIENLNTTDPDNPDTEPREPEEETESTCKVDGIGWLLCPVVNFLSNVADGAMDQVNNQLDIESAKYFEQGGPASTYWGNMREYANIIFVIGFIFIIFSQVTSIGLSNYGIKKMLPKLIAVALLVNLSWYITVLAVDASNFLGYAFSSLLGNALENPITPADIKSGSVNDGGLAGIGAAAIIGAVTVGTAAITWYFFLAAFLGVVLTFIVTIITVVIVLAIREAAVIVLVVVSPIAFACMLLPNTEGVFKKWLGIFKTLLILFPIISLLYGAAKMASIIIVETATDNAFIQLIGSMLPFLVLITVVTLTKKALNVIDGLDGVANGIATKGSNLNNAVLGGMRKRDQEQRQILGNGFMKNTRTGRFLQRGQAQRSAHLDAQKSALDVYKQEYSASDAVTQDYINQSKAFAGAEATARQVQNQNYATALQSDPALLAVAGGNVDSTRGQNRASRAAQAELDKAWNEDVTNSRLAFAQSPTDVEARTIATTGRTGAGVAVTDAERQAAVMHLMERGSTDDKQAVISSAGSITDQRTKNTLADMYAKSNLANLYGTGLAGAIKTATPNSGIDLNQTLIDNLGKVTPETIASNVKYAEALKNAYAHVIASGNTTQIAQAEGNINTIVDTMRKTDSISSDVAPDGRHHIDNLTTSMGGKYTGTVNWT